ncbi:MAG TPA: bifunctional DNA-formamidopyrimidine glycosylase/DNA-(apurinic or apyrimidinic site) lyase [Gammaproteobacteria bacterium]|nr:bifunctional DNA-formamidopyrimidine glycosylase/DNA-(apurinic or apyrimidinic site) lyase [Gammaproteobacteria bacterium]
MPELPEVETTRLGLKPYLEGQIIQQVIVRDPRLRWPIPSNINKILPGQTVHVIERRGKYLLFKLDNGSLIIHLGMSGRLRIFSQPTVPQKHDHLDIKFCNQLILRFTDPRRFGACLWVEGDPLLHPLLKNLGVEPLQRQFTSKYLWQLARNRKMPIKNFIMSANIVVGVGNIYANEALFAARIHPARPADNISLEEFNQLVIAVKAVLRQAIAKGGTTLKDFFNSEGKAGYFVNQLQVYGRQGQACVDCGLRLKAMRIGQRSSVYCPHCQPLMTARRDGSG